MNLFETANKWYEFGIWNDVMLKNLVKLGKLTQEEYYLIVN